MAIDWNELVRTHSPTVWRAAWRLLGDEADAADCLQRTFLAAARVAASETIRDWPALLARLTTARALEQLRVRYRERGRNSPLSGDPACASALDPLDAAIGGELAEGLREALALIDPVQAELFCLVELQGLTNAEAGRAAGVSANHAGVLLFRAKRALRSLLAKFDPAGEVRP